MEKTSSQVRWATLIGDETLLPIPVRWQVEKGVVGE
jgi:hypothetical protein